MESVFNTNIPHKVTLQCDIRRDDFSLRLTLHRVKPLKHEAQTALFDP
jgi:hypothetical protein